MSNEHVHPIMRDALGQFATKDMSELIPAPEEFDPLAMAERFKAANNGKADLQPTLVAMMNAISHKTTINDPEYRYLLGAEIIMEYIYDWAIGTKTDQDLLDLIEITVRGTQADIDKKAMEAQQ